MKVDALIMDPKDNVVTCVRDVKAGEVVQLLAEAEVPDGVGAVTGIDWIFENE